jgi:hypothetical protein
VYAVVQVPLVIAQLMSAPDDPLNKQVGSDTAGLVNSGVVRVSGPFSAPAGFSSFLALALASGLILSLIGTTRKTRVLGTMAALSSVAMAAVGGNRLAVLNTAAVVLVFVILHIATGTAKSVRRLVATFVLGAASVLAMALALPAAWIAFQERFADAAEGEDSTARLFQQTFGFLDTPITLLGSGAGAHSQAGIALGSTFDWIEWDAERWVAELGLVGLALAVARIIFAIALGIAAVRWIGRREVGAVLMASTLVPMLLYGQITQFPSNQAYFAIALSMLLLFRAQSDLEGVAQGAAQDRRVARSSFRKHEGRRGAHA